MELRLSKRVNNLCDYTYGFTWQNHKLDPDDVIPYQENTSFTFRELVDELRKGREVRIYGDVGERLGYSMGVDVKHLGGSGKPEKAGKIFIEGDVSKEMGMGMVSGTIYVKGNVEEPMGNLVEVESDEPYRKFRSITDILCHGLGKDVLVDNSYDKRRKHLMLNDGILRGTIASRCNCKAFVTIEGDVYNGTGLLMQKGVVHVKGNAGMNTGAHLDGGTVIVEGICGEFAGAYMKKGVLILNETKGFVGINMQEGTILARKKIKTSSSIEKLEMSEECARIIMKHLDIGHVEAMSYHRYGIKKETLVRMRDGSVVVRRF